MSRFLTLVVALGLPMLADAAPKPVANKQSNEKHNHNNKPVTKPSKQTATPRAMTNSVVRIDYESYRLISDKNIFNASRYGRSPRNSEEEARPVKVDAITLVGVMNLKDEQLAFFDAADSQFRKMFKVGSKVVGYTIQYISTNTVCVEFEGKQEVMRVGMQFTRKEDGPWKITEAAESSAPSFGSFTAASGSRDGRSYSSGGSSSGFSGGAMPVMPGGSGMDNEVLKRLMQRREQEMKR